MRIVDMQTGSNLYMHTYDSGTGTWVPLNRSRKKRRTPNPPDGPIKNIAQWCCASNMGKPIVSYDGILSATKHPIVVDTTSIQLKYVFTRGFVGTPKASKIKVAVGIQGEPAKVVYFGGADSIDVKDGSGDAQIFISDPLPVSYLAGDNLYVYTWLDAVNASGDVPSDMTGYRTEDLGVGVGSAISARNNLSMVEFANRERWSLRPTAILAKSDKPSWLATGDSIAQQALSFVEQAPNSLGLATTKNAKGGDAYAYHTRDEYDIMYDPHVAHSDYIIDEFSINDRGMSGGWEGLANKAIIVWKKMRRIGYKKILKTSMTLYTGSSDNWTTVEGQTVDVNAADAINRKNFNDWLRDGAPYINDKAVAVGTPNANRARVVASNGSVIPGSGNHYLDGISDVAEAIESSKNSHKYSVESLKESGVYGKTQDGLHPALGIHNILARRLSRDMIALGYAN